MIKKYRYLLIMAIVLGLMIMSGCNKEPEESDQPNNQYDEDFVNDYNAPYPDHLLFKASFDENGGNKLNDEVSNTESTINYVFTDAKYKPSSDPVWNTRSAASGSCLAFDGYSNSVTYDKSVVSVSGSEITVDVFVAPRMFEWDAPFATENGTEALQVIVGQYDKSLNAGFVVAMHKHGDFTFQLGLGDRWVKLWNEWNTLDRYTWNHLTCVFNGDTGYMAIYKNGEIINYREDVFGEIKASNTNLLIGKSQNPQYSGPFELNMYNGLMDELKIYNTAFNENDITNYHQSFYIQGALKKVIFEDAWLDESILDEDIYKPQYHASPPQHWMNEPHALFYYNGFYHLFYQFNLTGPYWRQISWGHWVSPDLVDWTNVKEAIIPMANSVCPDGIWSGGVSYKKDGTPVLFFTAGDDAKTNGLYSNQNVGLAVPKDLSDPYLTEWVVSEDLAIEETPEMGVPSQFRDFNVYQEDGTYYLVATGARFDGKGTAHLFTTKDDSFMNWHYEGELFTPPAYYDYMGTSWELVNLNKVYNGDKTISKYLFVFSPAGANSDNDIIYYLGSFDKVTKTFIPENREPLKMDLGENVFTGPTLMTDPKTGRVLICSIIQDQRTGQDHYDAGWAHTAGTPRELMLDDKGNLIVKPIDELDSYKKSTYLDLSNETVEDANQAIVNADINNQQLYLHYRVQNDDATTFGIKLKKDFLGHETLLYYDTNTNQILIDTSNAGVDQRVRRVVGGNINLINGDTLDLEIYIDHAMIECYINGQKTITAMVYNVATGIEVFGNGNISVNKLLIQSIEGGNE